ncbi:MAG TPA: hypothetical protein VM939_01370 [Gemmatimonadaceae bacterium]|nr:hypothetical protein [Gemmatimonadaceae bacterium]
MISRSGKNAVPRSRVIGLFSYTLVAAGLVAVLAATAAAQAGSISGAAISKVGKDTRKLTVTAQAAGSAANGSVQFIHNSPAGMSRFRGTVSCLNVSGETVQVSGVVEKGETATGTLLDGKAYAITIKAGSAPQSFSLPSFGEQGAVGACSGGRAETVPVTEEGFRIG